MRLAVSFTNLGPYHLARLRAAAARLKREGGELIAYETASAERLYPWVRSRRAEPFHWATLRDDRPLEDLSADDCAIAIEEALERDRPDAVAVAGYVRPEAVAATRWAKLTGRAAILMSESQAVDRPRSWWREALKRVRIGLFSSALVGGPSHRDYLVSLGMPAERIAFGYNAVDNARFTALADASRAAGVRPKGAPERPFFLSVSRFAPEKNLPALVRAYSAYRSTVEPARAWDLVLIGSGPGADEVEAAIHASGCAASIHTPGFLQSEALSPWYAWASAFVLASTSEPWGLVVNEAAASGLPLLVSERAGAAGTLVPAPRGTAGATFDPGLEAAMTEALWWMAGRSEPERRAMGERARQRVDEWGPERFASGLLEAAALSGAAATRPLARAS